MLVVSGTGLTWRLRRWHARQHGGAGEKQPAQGCEARIERPDRLLSAVTTRSTTCRTDSLQHLDRGLAAFGQHEYAAGRGPKVLFDGLQPPVGGGRLLHSSFAQAYPAEVRKRVIEKWQ